ncbi:MAG: C40 family peptidase [Bacillaceae bacterium]|nr:C40 family peptidase [Bacillaceae bacterium]
MQPGNLKWPVLSGILLLTLVLFSTYFTGDENRARPGGAAPFNLESERGPDGNQYYPLFALMEELNYQQKYIEKENVYQFGFTDPQIEYRPDEQKIRVMEEDRWQNVWMQNGQAYVSEKDIGDLFDWVSVNQIETLEATDLERLAHDDGQREQRFTAQARFNPNRLIERAKRQLNTPYVFGAPFGTTRIFDCSTFTKYVFAKEGIHLPRTSRAQARVGRRVSIDNLRRGDLLFFYVPGRYRSNRVVGHVAIYMGNGRMIHAYPPDVKIDSLNEPTFRETFLFAKRIR